MANRDAEVQGQDGREQYAAPHSGQRPEQTSEKSKDHEKECGYHGCSNPLMPICSMGILTLCALIVRKEMLGGKFARRKLRDRPRLRSGIGMFVRVVTGPHQRSGLDMAETEAQSLFPQIGELPRLIEAGNRQVVL